MIRTQIYLPEYEYRKLKEKAKVADKTFAQVVREFIRVGLNQEESKTFKKKKTKLKPKMSGAEYLLEMAREAERLGFEGPPDSSVTVDEVLYGLKK